MKKEDPFGGIWKLNPEKSHFEPNHRPTSATMYWERTPEGYGMRAEGTNSDGQVCQEKPQRFILDGLEHAVPEVAGVTAVISRPEPNAIQAEAKHAGRVVGKASYVVSEDGATLIATVLGMDAQQRPFQTILVWDRQPDGKELCP